MPECQGTFARDRRDIWSLSDSNRIRTQNHLIHKWTLHHLAKMAKWLSCVVSTYLYVAFGCMFLSSHVHVLELIYTLSLPECQETTCSSQAQYLKFKWQQRDSNPEPLNSQTNTQPFIQIGQIIELCCEYVSVQCIWMYVIIM